jgi:periplasmic divalent cation tolerance protein
MSDKKIVLTTVGSREEGQKMARALVERQLAACVNVVGPMDSVYRWKGAVETAVEWLLVIKTAAGQFERLRAAIQELHTYELPECVEIAIEAGSEEYLRWIGENVG